MTPSTSKAGNSYPYPSTLNIAIFVTIKLSDSSNYSIWKAQMLCLLECQELVGFIDGTIQPPLKMAKKDNLAWKRSDRLVKGWILGSLTEQMLQNVAEKVTARDVWLKLKEICSPISQDESEDSQPTTEEAESMESGEDYRHYLPLYNAARLGVWEIVEAFLHKNKKATKVQVTSSLQTPLHVALTTVKSDNAFVEKFVALMKKDELSIRDRLGETPLHYAARYHNLNAAKTLVTYNSDLPYIPCHKGFYPIHLAAEHGDKSINMVKYFMDLTMNPAPFTGDVGVKLLRRLIRSDLYDPAVTLVERFPDLAKCSSNELSPLALLATKISVFVGESRLSSRKPASWIQKLLVLSSVTFMKPALGLEHLGYKIPKNNNAIKLAEILCEKLETLSEKAINSIVGGPLLQAARFDNYKLVEIIVKRFPSSVYYCDSNGKTALHVAVENRSKYVFCMIYRMSQHSHLLMTSMDHSENTMLHLAGKLLPENKLSHTFGAALQMQQELQWFQDVKKHVEPSYYEILNNEGKTAHEVFTENHANLKKEGEEWLKDTANSCSLIAALIATIAFAAAVTVPGGNSESGFPIFTRSGAFVLFALSNGISLFTSSTSLLAFVSIITSRKAEYDFLHALPISLSIGLSTLIISIWSMTVSFGATLYLVLRLNRWLLIPLSLFALFPIFSILLWLVPLFYHVSSSTLGLESLAEKVQKKSDIEP